MILLAYCLCPFSLSVPTKERSLCRIVPLSLPSRSKASNHDQRFDILSNNSQYSNSSHQSIPTMCVVFLNALTCRICGTIYGSFEETSLCIAFQRNRSCTDEHHDRGIIGDEFCSEVCETIWKSRRRVRDLRKTIGNPRAFLIGD